MVRKNKEEEEPKEEPNFPPPGATFVSDGEVPRSNLMVQTGPEIQTNPEPFEETPTNKK